MTDTPLTTTTLETVPGLKLSPPPASTGLAAVATVVSALLFLAVGAFTAAGVSAATTETAALAWIFLVGGIILAAIPLLTALFSVAESVKTGRLLKQNHVLVARAHASRSRELAWRSFGIAGAVVLIVAFVFLLFANDASVQKTFLRWDIITGQFAQVAGAFGMNIFISVMAEIIVLVLGLLLAVARMLPGRAGAPVRWLAIAYIDVMRAVPAIIIIYLVGFGLPLAKIPFLETLDPTWFAIIALSLTYSAYVAETYRSGIESIHQSQFSAARSLGFSFGQTMRLIILPQAIRNVIPPLLTMFIGLQKDTALVNVIGAMDSFNQAKYAAATSFNLTSVTIVAILFIVITIPQTRFVDWWLERGTKKRGGKR